MTDPFGKNLPTGQQLQIPFRTPSTENLNSPDEEHGFDLGVCLDERQLMKLGNHSPENVVHISLVVGSIGT